MNITKLLTTATLLAATTGISVAQTGKTTVLIQGNSEVDAVSHNSGAAGAAGGVIVGSSSGSSTFAEHSEVWEAVRRFVDECPSVTTVTDPSKPHDLVVRMDYEIVDGGPFLGKIRLYQLATILPDGSPLLITKKGYLRRLIKPTCKAIEGYTPTNSKSATGR